MQRIGKVAALVVILVAGAAILLALRDDAPQPPQGDPGEAGGAEGVPYR